MNTVETTGRRYDAILDIAMPLQTRTDCAANVAEMVRTLLHSIAACERTASHSDILQALSITTAVRTAMADAAERGNATFSMDLLDLEVGNACEDGATMSDDSEMAANALDQPVGSDTAVCWETKWRTLDHPRAVSQQNLLSDINDRRNPWGEGVKPTSHNVNPSMWCRVMGLSDDQGALSCSFLWQHLQPDAVWPFTFGNRLR